MKAGFQVKNLEVGDFKLKFSMLKLLDPSVVWSTLFELEGWIIFHVTSSKVPQSKWSGTILQFIQQQQVERAADVV